ncbi:MAG: phage terminase large subunit [Isosphaeraceae bacterium]|nr:phage terminase large subunit [Isosphaeraceae bacterium]
MKRLVRAEKARRSLAEFVQQAWPVVEPGTPLVWNWHIDAICLHLEGVTSGRIRRLIINVPPGHMKSLLVSVFWPAWEWVNRPETRNLFSSYALELATRDSVRCRDLLASAWYRETFTPSWNFKNDQNIKTYFENDATGFRVSLSVGSKATGFRGDKVVVDDPLNAKDQYSELARQECLRWWDGVMSSRLNDPRTGARVIIMQRLHEQDLSGHMLAKGGYEHLCLPSEYEPERTVATSIGWSDPRREPSALLFPTLFPAEVLAEAKKDLGSSGYAGQHQQRPSPAEGGVFKQHWFRYWTSENGGEYYRLLADTPRLVRASDCRRFGIMDLAFSTRSTADFTVIQAWAVTPDRDLVLLDCFRERIEGPKLLPALERMVARHELAFVGIEDVQGQTLLVQAARRAGLVVKSLRPDRDKVTRAIPAGIRMEAEQVFFLRHAPWLIDLEHELLTFPSGAHDDLVDCLAYATSEVVKHGGSGVESDEARERRERAEQDAVESAEREHRRADNPIWWS